MPFAAALSTARECLEALAEVCDRAGGELGSSPDLAVVFFSAHHAEKAPELAAALQKRLAPTVMLGCVRNTIRLGFYKDAPQQ